MNAIFVDAIARQHADALMAEAAQVRLARQARKGARRSEKTASSSKASRRSTARSGAAVAQLLVRPFSAAQNWIAAGQL